MRTATAAVAARFAEVEVLNGEDWPSAGGEFRHDLVRTAYERMAGPPGGGRVPVVPETTAEGWRLTRVPVPVRPPAQYAEWARAHESALRAVLPGGRIDADVVHGHTGIYGGWAACRLARPGARVVVTEHASFLPAVLRQPASRGLYGEVVERADAFLCVSPWLRERLAQSFPEHAEKFRVVPNAVDVAAIPRRPARVRELRRWLFVGNLVAAKGVPLLLTAFAAAVADDPALELTLVGPGDADAVRRRAAELGVAGQVVVRGPVDPDEVFPIMHQHDLLVHPSSFETFGMTVVEAVASGMPVLVTRCGGPEQTMAGLEGVAGRLVDVADGPGPLLEGYRQLVAGVERLDPVRARAAVEQRFGLAQVGAELAEVYGPTAPGPAPAVPSAAAVSRGRPGGAGPDAWPGLSSRAVPGGASGPSGEGTVLLLALGGTRLRAVVADAAWLAERGVPVVVAAARREVAEAAAADPRVGVLRLPSGDGPLGPWLLWRLARRGLRGLLGGGPHPVIGRVVVCDAPAVAFAWHLARSEPQLPMRWCVERGAYAQPEGPSSGRPVEPPAGAGVREAVR
ncbi:glycosyltransferase family 4 protein [Streptacidiphilus griseoplanus]|uniref:glycosyltransferase family 4 protein n=1 Tax=Peterkaempfera griseoplana TaxID=66896 RepID=UPI0006E2103C|nr:glycosyltransferase family 4 protein [Peterkaempfera griseoplana]